MKRRVIKQGNNTLTITLPRKWARDAGIKSGDELEVEEKEGALCINSSSELPLKKIQVNMGSLGVLKNRTIIGLYRFGYDEVELFYDSPELISSIRAVLNECIGFEIVKQGNKSVLIKDLTGRLNLDFKMMLRRLFLILKGMIEDGFLALEKKDLALLKTIPSRDIEINKFSQAGMRYLFKTETFPEKLVIYFLILNNLELIGDEYKKMFNFLLSSDFWPGKEYLLLYKELQDFYNLVYELTFSPTEQKLQEIARNFNALKEKIGRIKNLSVRDAKILFYFQSVLDQMLQIQGIQIGFYNFPD